MTFAEIKSRLTAHEHAQAESGDKSVFLAEDSPTSFVVAGLELEELQCVLPWSSCLF